MNNITRFLTGIVGGGVAPLEQALAQMLTERALDTAIGVQLDQVGKLVGQPRVSDDDEIYRMYCRARILTNRSKGNADQLVKIGRVLVNDATATIHLQPEGTATLRMRIDGIAYDDERGAIVCSFVQAAASDGVRVVVQWGDSAPSGWFRFDSGPGFDVGRLTRQEG